MLFDLVFELNNELRPNTIFKQPPPVINQQARPTAAVNIPSGKLSTSRLTLNIDKFECEYNSRPPPTLPPQLLHKIQQHPVSIVKPTSISLNWYIIIFYLFFFSLFSTATSDIETFVH